MTLRRATPNCSRHPDSKVWFDGRYGAPGRQRQRFRCLPENGDPPHRFVETLPRLHGGTGECLECERDYAAHEGPPAGRGFDYTTREIAHALVLVGKGEPDSYVARELRRDARRSRSGRTRTGRRARNNDGSVVADWIDLFAPPLFAARAPSGWPRIVAVDALPFNVSSTDANGQPKRAGKPHFQVFGAYGWNARGQGSILALRAAPNFGYRQGFPYWVKFLEELRESLEGAPPVQMVCDNDHELQAAIEYVWPTQPAPAVFLCHEHLRQSLRRKMRRRVLYPDPLWDAIKHERPKLGPSCSCAFCDLASWQAFEAAALARGIVPITRWVNRHGARITWQLQEKQSHRAIVSVGPLEQAFAVIRNSFELRRGRFTNLERMNRRLALMQLELNGQANLSRYAQDIRAELLRRNGHGGVRRVLDDAGGTHSLQSHP